MVSCSPNRGDRVSIVGDSIITFDTEALQKDLGGEYKIAVSGNFGSKIDGVLAPSQLMATQKFDQVIFNVGTNDAIGGVPPEESVQALSGLVALFPAARCIHIVNVNEHMVNLTTGARVGDAARRLNEAVERYVASDDRLSVIDWNAEAEATLDDKDPPTSTLTADSVHPNAEGNEVLNGLYSDALRSC